LLLAIVFLFLAWPLATAFHTAIRDPPGKMYGLDISKFKACLINSDLPSLKQSYDPNCVFEKRIWAELKNPQNKKPGYAILLVYAQGPYNNPGSWSGSILVSILLLLEDMVMIRFHFFAILEVSIHWPFNRVIQGFCNSCYQRW